MDGAVLLKTRAHIEADRDFLFGWLRELNRIVLRLQDHPGDEGAILALHRELSALRAFAGEMNVQGETPAR